MGGHSKLEQSSIYYEGHGAGDGWTVKITIVGGRVINGNSPRRRTPSTETQNWSRRSVLLREIVSQGCQTAQTDRDGGGGGGGTNQTWLG